MDTLLASPLMMGDLHNVHAGNLHRVVEQKIRLYAEARDSLAHGLVGGLQDVDLIDALRPHDANAPCHGVH